MLPAAAHHGRAGRDGLAALFQRHSSMKLLSFGGSPAGSRAAPGEPHPPSPQASTFPSSLEKFSPRHFSFRESRRARLQKRAALAPETNHGSANLNFPLPCRSSSHSVEAGAFMPPKSPLTNQRASAPGLSRLTKISASNFHFVSFPVQSHAFTGAISRSVLTNATISSCVPIVTRI